VAYLGDEFFWLLLTIDSVMSNFWCHGEEDVYSEK
jgi:hypothetical protein